MGIYYRVHAGPVLVCQYHMEEKVEKETVKFNGCSNGACKHNNPKHRLPRGGMYCPQCGSPTQSVEKEKEKRTQAKSVGNLFDVMSEGGFREDTFQDCWGGLNREELVASHDVLSPTSSSFLGRKMVFEVNDFAIHLANPDIQAEIAKTKEFFANEIEYLRTKYDSVRIEWMVLTTGS